MQGQCLSVCHLQQLHGNEVLAVRFIDFVDRTDVRMIERGCSVRSGYAPSKIDPRFRPLESVVNLTAECSRIGWGYFAAPH